ncbi:MAG: NAD(P) transhydrogenase subunit alpha [Oscillospiraceae bacterium]|nr:NAD(P) transhydrogenase subunit alpha [Oscillospiraceae bacterium]
MDTILLIFIFVIAAFLGKELISKVPSQLHTPLMSATNAISGITVVGAFVALAASAGGGTLGMVLAFIAIVLATINLVGGFMVTERMLEMFRKKEDKK